MRFLDATGTDLSLRGPARRLVSLIPSITETLFLLGAGDRVVGVTKWCEEPREGVATKVKVGGEKDPDLQKILGLGPDLVIANIEENLKRDVAALRAAGVPVYVCYPRTVKEGIDLVRTLGALTETGATADGIAAELDAALEGTLAATAGKAAVRVFCPIWRRPYMTINADTYIHDMLRVSGGANVFADRPERYPTISLDDVAAARPEVILLPDEPYRFLPRHVPELEALDIPAARTGRIHLVDGKVMCWYGPRIAASLRLVRGLLAGD